VFLNCERFFPQEQKYCKYWLDKYFWKASGDINEYPLKPEYEEFPLFSGFLRKFIFRVSANRDFGALYSIQKGTKQGWPSLDDAALKSRFQEHEKLFCRAACTTSDVVLESIRQTSCEVFANIQDSDCTKFHPTGRAAIHAPRSRGGTGKNINPFKIETLNDAQNLSAKKIGFVPLVWSAFENHRHKEFSDLLSRVEARRKSGDTHLLDLEAMAIPEAAKFRILTLMDADLANVVQPLQGALLGKWKHQKASTMLTDDLTNRVRQIAEQHQILKTGFNRFVSGDYSSATDTLNRDQTCAALYGARGLKAYEMGLFSFQPGQIKYPEPYPASSRHREGQPMGHPLSFPLLCVINLSTYRLALKRWVEAAWESCDYEKRQLLLLELWDSVIVNGDDIAFMADDELYKVWLGCVSEHNFLPSMGKNYFTDELVQINSQLFDCKRVPIKRVEYLSQKVVCRNDVKKMNIDSESLCGPIEVCRDLNRMIRGDKRFLSVVPMALSSFSHWNFGHLRPNWYLPVELGGFGLTTEYLPIGSYITRTQRRFMAQYLDKPCQLYRIRSVEKTETSIHEKLSKLCGNSRSQIGPYVPLPCEVVGESNNFGSWVKSVESWSRMGSCQTVGLRVKYQKMERHLHPVSELKANMLLSVPTCRVCSNTDAPHPGWQFVN